MIPMMTTVARDSATAARRNRASRLRVPPARIAIAIPTRAVSTPIARKTPGSPARLTVAVSKPPAISRMAAANQHQKAALTIRGRLSGAGEDADIFGSA